jgi:phosphopantetheinyl transferase (holo-ACP synthase)
MRKIILRNFSAIFSNNGDDDCSVVTVSVDEAFWNSGNFEQNTDLLNLLSAQEQRRALSFGSSKRIKQFLLGRIAAKAAIYLALAEKVLPDNDLNEDCLRQILDPCWAQTISIENAADGCPHLVNSSTNLSISISHVDNFAAAVAFRKSSHHQSWGIDVEHIDSSRLGAMKRMTLESENIQMNAVDLTLAWTLKEALSKALLCGLAVPVEHLKIKEIIPLPLISETNATPPQEFLLHCCSIDRPIMAGVCSYENHEKYLGMAIRLGDKFLAIARPTDLIQS